MAGQKRRAHAISNPTLANIEKRWEAMPPQEQADLWMALRDRMKTNWAELTVQEKKAGLFSLLFLPSRTYTYIHITHSLFLIKMSFSVVEINCPSRSRQTGSKEQSS